MGLSKYRRRAQNKAAQRQEDQMARDTGGRAQAGSGCSWRATGDTRTMHVLRGQCKSTVGKSISVKKEDLATLERQAGAMELPVFQLQYEGMGEDKRYAVIPWWHFQQLLASSGMLDETDE